MTSFTVETFGFTQHELAARASAEARFSNWPVVYVLNDGTAIYVGETLNAVSRLGQHLMSPDRGKLTCARVILDETFNKSACLDLESALIRLFAGDGRYAVLNRNDGVTDSEYFQREDYRQSFAAIYDELLDHGVLTRPVADIENDDLFKLSPFKALTQDQKVAVADIVEGLFEDIVQGTPSQIVIQGDPGTGKTVVAIYLMKLLTDIRLTDPAEDADVAPTDSPLSEFFVPGYPELLSTFRVGLVVPQQSLRKSIQRVFAKTPGLDPSMVVGPFEVGADSQRYDLLIVDETHRLSQRANQSSGMRNSSYVETNVRLFGKDDLALTQLDWIEAQSDHQVYLADAAQAVIPADVPAERLNALVQHARKTGRHYPLKSQMRVRAGEDYVDYIRRMLDANPPVPRTFADYDLRMFDDLGEMREEIRARDAEVGLARLAAGFAWPWKTKKDKSAYDIELDGLRLRWNGTDVDWVNSPGSLDEVGSIHTIQGYDLNYAGIIIGGDLRFDPSAHRLYFDRSNYFDRRGKQNNKQLGVTYTDDDLLRFVTNIYAVLLTRGIRGTYVYVCDPSLREYLRHFLPAA